LEKRKFERVPFNQPVVIEDEAGESHLADACDLSIGGMFVAGAELPFGRRVIVHVHDDTGGDWTMALGGIVRWTRAGGVGIQFGMLGARETHRITEIVARATPSRTRARAAAEIEIPLELDLDDVAESTR
jgi:type IV pilus assembly protein PilZ